MREIKLFPNIRVFMCVSSLNSYHFDFNHWRTTFQSKRLVCAREHDQLTCSFCNACLQVRQFWELSKCNDHVK